MTNLDVITIIVIGYIVIKLAMKYLSLTNLVAIDWTFNSLFVTKGTLTSLIITNIVVTKFVSTKLVITNFFATTIWKVRTCMRQMIRKVLQCIRLCKNKFLAHAIFEPHLFDESSQRARMSTLEISNFAHQRNKNIHINSVKKI